MRADHVIFLIKSSSMLDPNTTLQNRYRIVRKLGQGGMGAIYEAIDQRVSCVVALKETIVGSSPDLREAFHREAALLANLRHASLPKVMDYFSEGDGEFLVMEFIAGQDLMELLSLRGGPMPQLTVLNWAIEILTLLEYLHTHEPSILHRDIKPANLKTTSSGEIFLLDFGLAKGATGQMLTVETTRSVPGYTPIYSPLEQILGQGTDQRSDIYALGATLYHLLTGEPPPSAAVRFNAIESDQLDPLRAPNQINVEITPEISACVQNAMALRLRDRTVTAQKMRLELERALRVMANRDTARKAEEDLLGIVPARDPSKPLLTDDDVQFTVYAPEKIKPDKNYLLLAFAHLTKRREDAAPDEPDPLEEVKKQASRLLSDQPEDYQDTKDSSSQPVPRGGEITFVPVVRGLTFNPPSRSFTWQKSVHKEEFDVHASADVDGKTLSGSMTVFLGSIVIANVNLTIGVDSNATPVKEKISLDQARSARRVRQVFASYSHKDEQVVAELAHVAPIFGSRFLLDRTHLEPGEDRVEGLQRLIRDADVFQLFWSTNSMKSSEIVDEIKYAAGLGRPGFILPTYWEEPIPRSPEEGLPPPEVDRLQFYRIYPGSISKTVVAKTAETRLIILGPSGSEIYIDDERQGSIGSSGRVILKSITTGKHLLRVTQFGHQDDERVIEVKSGTGEQIFQTFLKPPITASTRRHTSPAQVLADKTSPPRDLITSAEPATIGPPVQYQTSFTVRCSLCGMQYSAEVQFCRSCGNSLHETRQIQSAPQASFSEPPRDYKTPQVARSKRGLMIPIFAGAAMVLLIMIIAPVWLTLRSTSTASVAPPVTTANSSNSNTIANTNTTATTNATANNNTDTAIQVAPDGQFVDLNGETHRLRSFEGRVVALNFWSVANPLSRVEVPILNELQNRYGSRGLTVIGLLTNGTVDQVRDFQKETHQDYLVGFSDRKIQAELSTRNLPTTYVIDRRGLVMKKLVGPQSRETLESAIQPLLAAHP
ncbi:MAG: hypothetical protein C5B55_09265 [Blastocatellia bacterium]|nr:MAG: hypothetical protein C5B55_09265 [Blastocatellia bacterium]